MALTGKILKLSDGRFGFESDWTSPNEPKRYRNVYPITNLQIRGMVHRDETDALGRDAVCTDGLVSCYLGDGTYLHAVLPDGGATKAVVQDVIMIAPPALRGGIETRWHNGRWQKHLKRRGWVDIKAVS